MKYKFIHMQKLLSGIMQNVFKCTLAFFASLSFNSIDGTKVYLLQ
ncbi:hypothetical protein C900_03109 [Fulvivirga imtechensis AK7]|uniref:Uncharacterized protein n=1 Tax=Fulvivirga imtechensis AK7 TaxID=1237149 RepID=L8JTW1_9BACT|nr:hypothetical protein C900_03109 [Fulvivirga imtechensis AK7]